MTAADQLTEDRVVRVEEAAQMLGVGRTHIYSMIRDGQIPVVRIGRRTGIRYSDIRAAIDAHTTTVVNHPQNAKRDEKIRAAHDAGLNYSEIARAFGLTRQRIQQIVAEARS